MVAPTVSRADPLKDRHAEIVASIKATKTQMDEHSSALGEAEAVLAASQVQLAEVKVELQRTRQQLTEAKARDAELATELATEQARLRTAQRQLAKAEADVAEQQDLIGRAARDAFQGRTDLAGIAVVLGSETTGELGQRLQWDTTIFDSTAAQLERLEILEAERAEAERRQAAVEARIAAKKRESEENVAIKQALEAAAIQQETDVASLVTRNQQLTKEAQAALDADQAVYDELMAESAKVQGKLAARAADQLANGAPREDIAQLVAAGVISTNPATYPLANTGPQMILSKQGFIRPLKAKPGSPFGRRFHPILKYWRMHNGNDWGAACGVPLYAAQSGTVVTAGRQGGFGNYIVIDHGNIGGKSIMTGYAHQSKLAVKSGQKVAMGQLIGYVGTTGLSTGCHLHLQVYQNGTPVNPAKYIP
ncbi:MAG: peptidoglycan DD-metalloendopeptidase family protein [Propioniciclava sp.]